MEREQRLKWTANSDLNLSWQELWQTMQLVEERLENCVKAGKHEAARRWSGVLAKFLRAWQHR